MISPLPSSAPSNPLDVTQGQTCTGDTVTTARHSAKPRKHTLHKLKPPRRPRVIRNRCLRLQLDRATIAYHGLGSTYALSIIPKSDPAQVTFASTVATATPAPNGQRGGRGGFARGGILGCIPVHVAQPDDVTARKLYSPKGGAFTVAQLNFMPSVGLYIIGRQQNAGQETFRVYKLPDRAPSDPFQIRPADACAGDQKSSATEALGELKTYFANPAAGAKTPMWTITPHGAKGGTWYDLAPGDPALIGSLLTCGRVANATPQDIVAKGWDGAMPPHMNYASTLGLYIIRPQPNPNQNQNQARGSGP